MWRYRSTLVVLSVLIALGCSGSDKGPGTQARPPEVQVSEPIADTITDYEVFTGRTQALNAADLRSRVTGYLELAPFKQGDDVKKGDVLFVLQQRPFEAQVNQAKADRDQRRAQVTLAEALYARHQVLRNQNAMSQEEFQTTAAGRDTARAALASAEAALVVSQQNHDWATIRAPFSGRISRRLVDPGNDVIADNTVLASLVQVDRLYAYFDVDERTLLRIRGLLPSGKVPADAGVRLPVMLGLANEKPEEFSHEGTLEIADNKVDASTGTLRMWGVFYNRGLDLKPGMFVRVRMGLGDARPTHFIAESAIGSDQGRKFVYVLNEDDKVVYTGVTLGQRKNGLIAVESGLKGGERVVVNGLQRIQPAMTVTPKNVSMPRVGAAVVIGTPPAAGKTPAPIAKQ